MVYNLILSDRILIAMDRHCGCSESKGAPVFLSSAVLKGRLQSGGRPSQGYGPGLIQALQLPGFLFLRRPLHGSGSQFSRRFCQLGYQTRKQRFVMPINCNYACLRCSALSTMCNSMCTRYVFPFSFFAFPEQVGKPQVEEPRCFKAVGFLSK